jgi:hypothetical protein
VVNGFIQFTIAGGNERRSKFGSATTDAAHDENSVVFTKVQMPAFQALRDAVEKFIVTGGHPQPVATAAPRAATDRLAELTKLHDAGVLTDEEYQAKRAEVISEL